MFLSKKNWAKVNADTKAALVEGGVLSHAQAKDFKIVPFDESISKQWREKWKPLRETFNSAGKVGDGMYNWSIIFDQRQYSSSKYVAAVLHQGELAIAFLGKHTKDGNQNDVSVQLIERHPNLDVIKGLARPLAYEAARSIAQIKNARDLSIMGPFATSDTEKFHAGWKFKETAESEMYQQEAAKPIVWNKLPKLEK